MQAVLAWNDLGVIGNKGDLLWKIPEDMRNFRKLTMGNNILMGRATADSLGHPLSGRMNIVITSTGEYREGFRAYRTVQEAVDAGFGGDNTFFIGGAKMANAVKPFVTRWHMTEIHDFTEGDAKIPTNFFMWYDKKTVRRVKGDYGPPYQPLMYFVVYDFPS